MSKFRILGLAFWVGVIVLSLSSFVSCIDAVKSVYRSAKWEIAAHSFILRSTSVDCPTPAMTVLALGQSNAGNHVGEPLAASPDAEIFTFFRGRCYPLRDPLPGSTGSNGSLWTLFSERLSRRLGQPIIIISAAYAGSSVLEWSHESSGYARDVAKQVRWAMQSRIFPQIAIWIQGEADAAREISSQEYALNLQQVIDIIAYADGQGQSVEPRLLWLIAQATKCTGSGKSSLAVRQGQFAVTDAGRGVFAGPDLDTLGDVYRPDGCHFDSAGRERVVDLLIASVSAISAIRRDRQ